MESRIFGTALAIALLGCVWNVIALIASWFGLNLPIVEVTP